MKRDTFTIAEASKFLGITRAGVLSLLTRGIITGRKKGDGNLSPWILDGDSVERYQKYREAKKNLKKTMLG